MLLIILYTSHSGYIDSNMIKNYEEHRTKYSVKRTRGLANAVARCDEFLSDPQVSFGYIFSVLYFLFFTF